MRSKFLVLFLFAISMAFVEAATVIYLRALYYPAGFVATVAFSGRYYLVEVFREAATIMMLASVAFLSFARWKYRALGFFWIFAIWDLGYYLFLKIVLGWPATLGTVDVLFLIPKPSFAPVWFALACWSIVLVITSFIFFRERKKLA